MSYQSVTGERLGVRIDPQTGNSIGDVVRALQEQRPEGPAENSIFLVDRTKGDPRARYISWIGYFDIEKAAIVQPGCWCLVEPANAFREDVSWEPFAEWPDIIVPNHGIAGKIR